MADPETPQNEENLKINQGNNLDKNVSSRNDEQATDDFSSKLKLPEELVNPQPGKQDPLKPQKEFQDRLVISPESNEHPHEKASFENQDNELPLPRVVIILNNNQVLSNLEKIFDSKGFEIHGTMELDNGYKFIQQTKPDLILLDHSLSGNESSELVKLLRSDDKFRQVPIIMFLEQSHASEYNKIKLSRLGVTEFLTKPFLADWLFERIRKTLSNQFPRLVDLTYQPSSDQVFPSQELEETSKMDAETTGTNQPFNQEDLLELKRNLESILEKLKKGKKSSLNIGSLGLIGKGEPVTESAHKERTIDQFATESEVKRLKELLTETRKNLADMENEKRSKEQEIQVYKTQNMKLVKKLKTNSVTIEKLRSQLEKFARTLPNSKKYLLKQKTEIAKLENEIKVLLKRVQIQTAENVDLQDKLDRKHALHSELLQLLELVVESKNRITKLGKNYLQVKSWLTERDILKSELEKLQLENKALSKRLKSLNEYYKEKFEKLSRTNKERSGLQQVAGGINQSSPLPNSMTSFPDMDKEELLKTIGELKSQVSKLTGKINFVEKGKNVLRNKMANDLVEKEIQIMKLKADLDSYRLMFKNHYKVKEDLGDHAIADGEWPEELS